jgi:hypothetical protein
MALIPEATLSSSTIELMPGRLEMLQGELAAVKGGGQ